MDELYEEITRKHKDIKILRYSSMTDDKQKIKLKDVNEYWKEFQVVLYTPTIEAGVDFNIKYFHRMYSFLSNGSCPSRSFLQMTGRIRNLIDNNIRCFYDKNLSYGESNTYVPTLDEFEEYVLKNFTHSLDYEFVNNGDHSLLKPKKDAFTKTFAHNLYEDYMKKSKFMKVLNEQLTIKGYTYTNEDVDDDKDDNINDKNKDNISVSNKSNQNTTISSEIVNEILIDPCVVHDNSTSISSRKTVYEIEDLLKVPLVSSEDANQMNTRKNNNSASRYDKLCLKKFFMIKKFNIKEEDFTMEFLMNWFGKEHILDNVLYVIGKLKINSNDIEKTNKMKEIDISR